MEKIFLFIRSTVFNIFFYTSSFVICTLGLPCLLCLIVLSILCESKWRNVRVKYAQFVCRVWGTSIIKLASLICGIEYEVFGRENIPKNKGFIIASKHSSVWEIMFFLYYFKGVIFVLKKEVSYIPVIGLYPPLSEMIVVDREKGLGSIVRLDNGIKDSISKGRVCVIFPEGTRVRKGESVKYKPGIAMIYKKYSKDYPIIPTGVNSADYWPKNSWIKKPGKISVRFMPPLDNGMEKNEMLNKLQDIIDSNSL